MIIKEMMFELPTGLKILIIIGILGMISPIGYGFYSEYKAQEFCLNRYSEYDCNLFLCMMYEDGIHTKESYLEDYENCLLINESGYLHNTGMNKETR